VEVGAEKHITVKSKIPENDFLFFWKIIIESQKGKKKNYKPWFDILIWCGMSLEIFSCFLLLKFPVNLCTASAFKCILKACLFLKKY